MAERSATPDPKVIQPSSDDAIIPFLTADPDVRGFVVRLGPAVDTILKRHNYPEPVSHALGEAIALTGMIGGALPPAAKLSVQARTDGPLSFFFVDLESGGQVRATASFNSEAITSSSNALLGQGHMALTVEPGDGRDQSQGIVAIDGGSLSSAALAYFTQSEQLPTYLRLAVAKHQVAGQPWSWRAAGLMVQHLRRPLIAANDEDTESAKEDWNRLRLLAASVEDHELLDPALPAERLLYRLFHEESVRALPAKPLSVFCRCSRERVEAFLKSFGPEQLEGMNDAEGKVSVTCEFCSTVYRFDPADLN